MHVHGDGGSEVYTLGPNLVCLDFCERGFVFVM